MPNGVPWETPITQHLTGRKEMELSTLTPLPVEKSNVTISTTSIFQLTPTSLIYSVWSTFGTKLGKGQGACSDPPSLTRAWHGVREKVVKQEEAIRLAPAAAQKSFCCCNSQLWRDILAEYAKTLGLELFLV
ncbi:MAG: hypothetical protein CMI18_10235 [Opitutaceae bacterium]|nr:hypothetical protein [Opitutaceae bacterium]